MAIMISAIIANGIFGTDISFDTPNKPSILSLNKHYLPRIHMEKQNNTNTLKLA
jgi:hypothetical protein